MSSFVIPPHLKDKVLPNHKENILSALKDRYSWQTYGDINEDELKKVYKQELDSFWTIIKYLSFQGFKFKGKLSRYTFPNHNNIDEFTLVLKNFNSNCTLDYDFKYAFLKLQLQSYGIYEKYDLHLVPVHHILNKHMNPISIRSFFEKEGFLVLKSQSVTSDYNFNILLNNEEKNKSTIKDLFFSIGNITYKVPFENGNISLISGTIPPSKVLNALIKRGFKVVSDLPTDMTFLLDIPYVSHRAVEKFINSLSGYHFETIDSLTVKKLKEFNTIAQKFGFNYYGEHIPVPPEIINEPIKQEQLDNTLYDLFIKNNLKIIGELPYDIEAFLRGFGFKKSESRKLSTNLFNCLPFSILEELFFNSLKRITYKDKPDFINERDWEIILYRIGGNTLEEVGEKFELTRERIRQITIKNLDKMFQRYNLYFTYLKKEISMYPFINIKDQFNGVDQQSIETFINFINVYSLPFNIYGNYLTTNGRETFLETFNQFKADFENSFEENHLFTRDEIGKYILSYFPMDKNDEGKIKDLTNEVIGKLFEPSNQLDHYIYKRKLSKARMCQIVFKEEFADGLEVYKKKDHFIKKLLEYYPNEFKNDSPRSIIANLLRDENAIVLWKVGYFKHISAINPEINAESLYPIKEWFLSKLSEDNIQINTNAAFKQFQNELKQLEIDTEHALFSLLKIYYPDTFNYSRSPTLVMKGYERMERRRIIENYVIDCNGYVTNMELINHFVDKLGWKKTMYEQNLAASECLLKTSDGYVHIDNLNIEKEDLESIYLYAMQKINQLQNSYSIETIFEERKSSLLQMNIRDSRILYHLLEKFYPDKFDFFRYPHIHPVGKYTTEQLSVVGQFKTFFLENEDCFLRDELYEEFVKERGWGMSTYYMAFNKSKDEIFEVFPEEFAHIQLVEWNKEKEKKLIEILDGFLIKQIDKPFIHIERDIIANDSLIEQFPDINPLFEWNHNLLVSILQHTNNYILLGVKKSGILAKNNSFNIKNEQDYISYLLKNKFDGFVKLSDLQKYLYSIDLCGHSSIPSYYLSSNEKELDYKLVNDEVILKELMVR
ncbi:sigma factor-like helix-turn-helix DNA-binding protein [Ornithinibacillus sp. 179-J 7C1 HS]|uniref:sigma factor-like helix-turn-helix DNA-binding protein n=1 Tax=Ornithinibacillus sp. 179-J 7C1 HS TaxID=3142384 RepID=UPI00399FF6C9